MKAFFIALWIGLFATPAFAVKQYNISRMTCAEVQAVLKRDGVAQLRYPAPDNPSLPLYDTYVGSSSYCKRSGVSRPAKVPTRDTRNCQVRKCAPPPSR